MSPRAGAVAERSADLAAQQAANLRDIYLFVRCHAWFMAINATHVDRIVMPSDTQLLPPVAGGHRPGYVGLALASGRTYSAWDLGFMLEQPALSSTWVMFDLPGPKGVFPMALRCGTCLSVSALKTGQFSTVPPGLLKARPGVYAAGYSTARVLVRNKPLISVGLLLDMAKLWTAEDLAFTARTLKEARR